jgi:hypothetical protein
VEIKKNLLVTLGRQLPLQLLQCLLLRVRVEGIPGKRPECLGTGVDVMITIFGDFRPFLAKKMTFFKKKQCYNQNFA